MVVDPELAEIRDAVEALYDADGKDAGEAITAYLLEQWSGLSAAERVDRLNSLSAAFTPPSNGYCKPEEDGCTIPGIFAQILKGQVTPEELSSEEFIEELAGSLDSLFDELNKLIQYISSMLMGEDVGQKTIRHIIGSQMRGDMDGMTVTEYIGQIHKAFKIAHEAFQLTVREMMSEILTELAPQQITSGSDISRFDPLRKARYFSLYEEKFRHFQDWFESQRFDAAFLQVFEKNCYRLTLNHGDPRPNLKD